MRITITCEDCGRRHRLERSITEAGPIWIVCHACETPLRADLELTQSASAGPATQFATAWAGIIDLSEATSTEAA
jgi:hypothetical protein